MSKDWTKRMRISLAGHCPFTNGNKRKVKTIRGNAGGIEDLSLKQMSAYAASQKTTTWCVGRNKAGKLGKAEKQNPVRICHYNQPLRVRAVG